MAFLKNNFLFLSLFLVTCNPWHSQNEQENGLSASLDEANKPKTSLEITFSQLTRIFAPHSPSTVIQERISLSDPNEQHTFSFSLEENRCYTFLAVADPTMKLKLTLQSFSQRIEHTNSNHFSVITAYCPSENEEYELQLVAEFQDGQAIIQGFLLPENHNIARTISALQLQFVPNARPIGPIERAFLGTDQTEGFAWVATPNTCYAIIAAGDENVIDADLILKKRDHIMQQQDVALGSTPVIPRFCSQNGETFRIELRVAEGIGWVSWQFFEVPPGPVLTAIPEEL